MREMHEGEKICLMSPQTLIRLLCHWEMQKHAQVQEKESERSRCCRQNPRSCYQGSYRKLAGIKVVPKVKSDNLQDFAKKNKMERGQQSLPTT